MRSSRECARVKSGAGTTALRDREWMSSWCRAGEKRKNFRFLGFLLCAVECCPSAVGGARQRPAFWLGAFWLRAPSACSRGLLGRRLDACVRSRTLRTLSTPDLMHVLKLFRSACGGIARDVARRDGGWGRVWVSLHVGERADWLRTGRRRIGGGWDGWDGWFG